MLFRRLIQTISDADVWILPQIKKSLPSSVFFIFLAFVPIFFFEKNMKMCLFSLGVSFGTTMAMVVSLGSRSVTAMAAPAANTVKHAAVSLSMASVNDDGLNHYDAALDNEDDPPDFCL